jgi:hypothetical protein
MHGTKICYAEPSSAKPDVLKSEIGGSDISRGSDDLDETVTVKPKDWRTLLAHYLENSGHVIYTKVRRQVLKYVLLYHDLYR